MADDFVFDLPAGESTGGNDFVFDIGSVQGGKKIDSSTPPRQLGVGADLEARYMTKMVADPRTLLLRLSERLGVDPRRLAIREGRPQVLVQGEWRDALPAGMGIADFVAQTGADAPVALGAGVGAGSSALLAPSGVGLLAGMGLAGTGAAAGSAAKRGMSRLMYDDPTPINQPEEMVRAGLEGAALAPLGIGADRLARRAGQFGLGSLGRRLTPVERASKMFVPDDAAQTMGLQAAASARAVGREATPAEVIPSLQSVLAAAGQAQPKLGGILSQAGDSLTRSRQLLARTGVPPVLGSSPPAPGTARTTAQAALDKLTKALQKTELTTAQDVTEVDAASLRQALDDALTTGNLGGKAKAGVQKMLSALDKEGIGGFDEYTAQEAKDLLRQALPSVGPRLEAAKDMAKAASGRINALYEAAKTEAAPLMERADAMGPLDISDLRDSLRTVMEEGAGGMPVTGSFKRALRNFFTTLETDLDGGTKANISQLQQLKEGLDDEIGRALGSAEPNRKMAKYLGDVRSQLASFMEESSPDYAQAMAVYREKMGVKDDLMATLIGKLKGANPERVLSLVKNADPERLAELSALVPEHARAMGRANLEGQIQGIGDTATGESIRKALLGTEKQRAKLQSLDPEAFAVVDRLTQDIAKGKARPTTSTVGKLHQMIGDLAEKGDPSDELLAPLRDRARQLLSEASPAYGSRLATAENLRRQLAEEQKGALGTLASGRNTAPLFVKTGENIRAISEARRKLAIENPAAWDDLLHTALDQHIGAIPPGGNVHKTMLGPPNNRDFWRSALADKPGAFRRLNQFTEAMDNLDDTIAALERGAKPFGRRAEESGAKTTGDAVSTLARTVRKIWSSTGREEAAQSRAFRLRGPELIRAMLDPKNTEILLQFRQAAKGDRVAARGVTTWLSTQAAESALNNPPSGEGMNLFQE